MFTDDSLLGTKVTNTLASAVFPTLAIVRINTCCRPLLKLFGGKFNTLPVLSTRARSRGMNESHGIIVPATWHVHANAMFECAELVEGSQNMMENMREQLGWVRDMWDAVDSFLTYQEECRNSLWVEADASAMEEETKSMMKAIKGTNKEMA